MIIKIKDINNNITFELLIESNILINDLHKCIRKVHNQYLGNNGIDVIRINCHKLIRAYDYPIFPVAIRFKILLQFHTTFIFYFAH